MERMMIDNEFDELYQSGDLIWVDPDGREWVPAHIHASLIEKVESYKNVLNAKGEVILANYWIDDEFRQTLHDCIDAQEDGEWITLIRYRPALLESER